MKKYYVLFLTCLSLILVSSSFSQNFSVENYKKFLNDNQNLSSQGLLNLYPPGIYKANAGLQLGNNIFYLDSVQKKYQLTAYENELLAKNGFVVTERVSFPNFIEALESIWQKDLPLFVTTDMILHAVHLSYDAILKDVEESIIIPKFRKTLDSLRKYLTTLQVTYQNEPRMKQMLYDYDVYFSVASSLLNGSVVQPIIQENQKIVDDILKLIESRNWADYTLFSSNSRKIDFSQFTIRGHYTQSQELKQYFQAMIWLGRTEFYLIAPESSDNTQTPEDIQRQIIDSYLILEASNKTKMINQINEIDEIIKSFVGDQDNVQISNLQELSIDLTIKSAADFLDMSKCDEFQNRLKTKPYADQKILSQILMSDPFSTDKIKPASPFLLMGQRFIIDSYIFANVVFDKIIYNNEKVWMALPNSLDVLFALGNNAAADLLKTELTQYHYGQNLAGLRYLVDSYDSDFWNLSIYNSWLNSIRSLKAPDDAERAKYPKFMRTAAWWQEKMNTQLSSWTQLRHDNLLYAKQSYTGGLGCSYPYVYVEPIVEFYDAIGLLAQSARTKLEKICKNQIYFLGYFDTLKSVSDRLGDVARKELSGEPLSQDDINFLRNSYDTVSRDFCGMPAIYRDGWYSKIIYGFNSRVTSELHKEFVVADVHTAPTDENGNMVGWVKHVGTGNVNLLIATVEDSTGNAISYCGPVMSYHEMTTVNFKRLTDEEWSKLFDSDESLRPSLVDLYLADKQGECRNLQPISLPTGANNEKPEKPTIKTVGFPNPFTENVLFGISIPLELADAKIEVRIFDSQGNLVRSLFNSSLSAGNFLFKWDGKFSNGETTTNGVYFYQFLVNGKTYSGKVIKN